MEILNTSRIGGGLFRGIALGVILSVTACASSTKRVPRPEGIGTGPRSATDLPETNQRDEVFGPFPSTSPVAGPAAPAEVLANPDRIVLVFGKGLSHGYVYVGVLRALQEMKIPVAAIYATEVGALAGALYYTQPNLNRTDWALLRFNEKNLSPRDGKFSFRLSSPEAGLEGSLREVFGDKRLESVADRLHIALDDEKTGEVVEARTGDLWRVLRGALAGANRYSSAEFEGRPVRASNRKLSEAYRLARQSEKYPVVVVAAGSPPSELFRKLVEDEKATLLYVPLPGIDDLDVKQRNQAVFSGKNAVHKAAKEILSLVGRKPDER